MAKDPPALVDPRLAKAFEHPIRIEILGILGEGPSSPARIQRRLDNVSLNLVSHHMKVLKELGYVELMETVTKRGAKEHIYRLLGTAIVSAEEWERLTPEMRRPITGTVLRMISHDLSQSLIADKFEERTDNHLSRSLLNLDREGWTEVVDVLARTLDEVLAAGERSRKRIESGGADSIPVTVAIMQFPTPDR